MKACKGFTRSQGCRKLVQLERMVSISQGLKCILGYNDLSYSQGQVQYFDGERGAKSVILNLRHSCGNVKTVQFLSQVSNITSKSNSVKQSYYELSSSQSNTILSDNQRQLTEATTPPYEKGDNSEGTTLLLSNEALKIR